MITVKLAFKEFIKSETNVPGGMGDYATGAYMSTSQTGSETSSDKRGLMPSTDLGIVNGRPVTGKIITVKYKENPIRIATQDSHGKIYWVALTKHEYDRISPSPRVGKMMTVVYQGDTQHIDKIMVHG